MLFRVFTNYYLSQTKGISNICFEIYYIFLLIIIFCICFAIAYNCKTFYLNCIRITKKTRLFKPEKVQNFNNHSFTEFVNCIFVHIITIQLLV